MKRRIGRREEEEEVDNDDDGMMMMMMMMMMMIVMIVATSMVWVVEMIQLFSMNWRVRLIPFTKHKAVFGTIKKVTPFSTKKYQMSRKHDSFASKKKGGQKNRNTSGYILPCAQSSRSQTHRGQL